MRWQAKELAAIDAWREQNDDKLSRAEAIRRLVRQALGHRTDKHKTQEALEVAAHAADRLVEQSMPPKEGSGRRLRR
jgi:hypothetical protein